MACRQASPSNAISLQLGPPVRPIGLVTAGGESNHESARGVTFPGASPPERPDVTIRFQCPACGNEMRTRDDNAGRRVRCSQCDRPLLVPEDWDGEPELLDEPRRRRPSRDSSPFQAPGGMDTPRRRPRRRRRDTDYSTGKGYATGSMVTGIIALALSTVGCCCLPFGFATTAVAVTAITLGILARQNLREDEPGHGQAIAGLVCGSVALAISLMFLVLTIVAFLVNPEALDAPPWGAVGDDRFGRR